MSALPSLFVPKDPRQPYGLSMRFRVTVLAGNGLHVRLGKWSGCSGLGLTLKFDEYVPGGHFEGSQRFPDRVTYGQITLERAMHAESSHTLQTWLRNVIETWMTADEGGARDIVGSDITIEMLSATDWSPIYQWTLQDAIPVSWTGPSLSAKSSDVATEKLVLAHNGVTGSKPGGAPAATSPARDKRTTATDGKLKLMLMSATDANAKVKSTIDFQYNPQKLTTNKTVVIKSPGLVKNRDEQLVDPGHLQITLSDLRVEGINKIRETVGKLHAWLKAVPVNSGPEDGFEEGDLAALFGEEEPEAKGGGAKAKSGGAKAKGAGGDEPKMQGQHVKLVMGARGPIEYRAVLKSVNVVYTRFTRSGIPNRATVSLTLQEVTPAKGGTNPTSGTKESGRAHAVTAGESLPGIAMQTYGSPAAWRRIAEENGIDDPLRLRNGKPLLLPGVG